MKRILSLVLSMLIMASTVTTLFIPQVGAASEYDTITEKKSVLAPGCVDNLLTEDYYAKISRSTAKDPYFDLELVMVKDTRTASYYAEWYTQCLGKLMGVANEAAYFHQQPWYAGALVYKVVPETYIATSLVGLAEKPNCFKEHYDFHVSSDGVNWESVSPTITQENGWEASLHYYASYKAVVKIPSGAKYYRITLAGFEKEATSSDEYHWKDVSGYVPGHACCNLNPATGENATGAKMAVGTSICSAYNLNEYTDVKDIPDYGVEEDPLKDKRDALKAVIDKYDRVKADLILQETDEQKANLSTFNEALAHAKTVHSDKDTTAALIDAEITALQAAYKKLAFKDIEYSAATATKSVLAPGCVDNLLTEEYYAKISRSTARDPYFDLNVVMVQDTRTSSYYAQWYSECLGKLMGVANEVAYFHQQPWYAGAVVYKVVPGSYIATSLVGLAEKANCFKEHYDFHVSSDGVNWDTVSPTITQENGWVESLHYYASYKAVVKIPEGAKYYRITLAGFEKESDSSDEYHYKDVSGCVPGHACCNLNPGTGENTTSAKMAIGTSICSAYNLNEYTDVKDVPDYDPDKVADPAKIKREELKRVLDKCDLVNLELVQQETDEQKANLSAFNEALAHAKTVYNDKAAVTATIDTEITALQAAYAKLTFDELENANRKQSDDRRFLKPGVMDNFENLSLIRDFQQVAGGGYYSDYVNTGIYSRVSDRWGIVNQFNTAATSWNDGSNVGGMDKGNWDLSELKFMGVPIAGYYWSLCPCDGPYFDYRVYSGSYVSSALIINTSYTNSNYPKMEEAYYFLISKDGEKWEEVKPSSLELVDSWYATGTSNNKVPMQVWKSVVKMPEGYTYYRVVTPGMMELNENNTWFSGVIDIAGNQLLGPTVSSMYDLSKYDNYADLPDKIDWYADPGVTTNNAEKVNIFDGYFAVSDANMTIAQAKALVKAENGALAFYDKNGKLITDDNLKITSDMKVDYLDKQDLPSLYHTGENRLSVIVGADIARIRAFKEEQITLDYGAPKTLEGLMIPSTVEIETGKGVVTAEIDWDIEGCDYDTTITLEQNFTVHGKVILPKGVTNNSGKSLNVSIAIRILEPYERSIILKDGEKRLAIDQKNGVIYFKNGIKVSEAYNALAPFGDVYYNLTKLDTATNKSVPCDDNELVTSYMVVNVYGTIGDVFLKTFRFESAEYAGVDFDKIGLDVAETGDNTSIALLITVFSLSGVVFFVLCKKRRFDFVKRNAISKD